MPNQLRHPSRRSLWIASICLLGLGVWATLSSQTVVYATEGSVTMRSDVLESLKTWGFSEGMRSLVIGKGFGPTTKSQSHLASQTCGRCHQKEFDAWKGSRHKTAWTNEVFQDGFRAEPEGRCIHCHAPLVEQAAEINEQMGDYRRYQKMLRNAHRPVSASGDESYKQIIKPLPEKALSHEGIGCVACHVRDGKILASDVPADKADTHTNEIHAVNHNSNTHDVSRTPSLKDPLFCAGCHQFRFHEGQNGSTVLVELPMQNTFEEWRAYRDEADASVVAGGQRMSKTCQECHMPEGSHDFKGAHNLDLLRSALKVDVQRMATSKRSIQTINFTLSSVNVGHHFPTGDLFRHLTLEVYNDANPQKSMQTLLRLGREYCLVEDQDGNTHKDLCKDTSLRPNVPVTAKLERDFSIVTKDKAADTFPNRYRVRYHYALEIHEERATIPMDELVQTIVDEAL